MVSFPDFIGGVETGKFVILYVFWGNTEFVCRVDVNNWITRIYCNIILYKSWWNMLLKLCVLYVDYQSVKLRNSHATENSTVNFSDSSHYIFTVLFLEMHGKCCFAAVLHSDRCFGFFVHVSCVHKYRWPLSIMNFVLLSDCVKFLD